MPLYVPPSDTAFASTWDTITNVAPSKNAVYDKFEAFKIPIAPIVANWILLGYDGEDPPSTTSNIAINTIYYSPFIVFRSITISDIGARVLVVQASSNFKLAIYAASSSTGLPTGTPLASTGDMSGAVAAAITADISGANVTLAPGIYWGAVWADTANITFNAHVSVGPFMTVVGSSVTTQVMGTGILASVSSAETYGTFPDAAGEAFTEVGSRAIMIYAKLA